MSRRSTIIVSALLSACLLAPAAGAQSVPASAPSSSMPTGFAVKGALSASVFSSADSVSFFNAASVPAVVLGYRMARLTIGLGLGLFRVSYITKVEDPEFKSRDSSTSMLFTPRFEIALVQRAMAEAYIALGFGVGFNVVTSKWEAGSLDGEDTDSGVALGGHAGLGGRVFFGGGPFGLGMEIGWSGLFLSIKDNENDETAWQNINDFYAALVGIFVFG